MLTEHRQMVEHYTGKSVFEVCEDIAHLKTINEPMRDDRRRIRDILNGGPEGIAALLGSGFRGSDAPVNNLIHSGLERFAQKIGRVPELKVDAHKDTQAARVAAEKREAIVRSYDDGCQLDMMLPQLGRWLPGYGFGVITVHDGYDADGNVYPMRTLRDPFDAYPSSWGVTQQPDRIAFIRTHDARQLAKLYPSAAKDLLKNARGTGGAYIVGDGYASGQWEGNAVNRVEVAEYIDCHGTWTICPDRTLLLDFTPNPIAPTPAFTVVKRFAFDRLIGHYDHVIGLMGANAKLNLLTLIAMEDSVFAEVVVAGELARGDAWQKGRNAVNYITAGSSVQRLGSGVNPQMFQEIDRIERQLRVTAGYPVIDDAQSPNSFVTGRGLDNLMAGADNQVSEYQQVLTRGIEHNDSLLLMWDEKAYPDRERTFYMAGRPGTYVPRKDIGGLYRTRRRYGVMAGWDDASKVVTGLQLLQAGIVDRLTVQENIRGLDDVTEVRRRIQQETAETALRDAMLAAAQQGDPKAVMALIEMLPAGDTKRTLQKFYTPEGPEMSEEEAAMAAPPEPQGPEATTTILSRLLASGESQGGAQTVGTL